MGARWWWVAVCSNLHVYSNFSGGADECYECGAEPEVEFTEGGEGWPTPEKQAEEYVLLRKGGKTVEQVAEDDEIATLHALAEKHGFKVSK